MRLLSLHHFPTPTSIIWKFQFRLILRSLLMFIILFLAISVPWCFYLLLYNYAANLIVFILDYTNLTLHLNILIFSINLISFYINEPQASIFSKLTFSLTYPFFLSLIIWIVYDFIILIRMFWNFLGFLIWFAILNLKILIIFVV